MPESYGQTWLEECKTLSLNSNKVPICSFLNAEGEELNKEV